MSKNIHIYCVIYSAYVIHNILFFEYSDLMDISPSLEFNIQSSLEEIDKYMDSICVVEFLKYKTWTPIEIR